MIQFIFLGFQRFYDQLQKSGYLSKLEQHKTLFREPKEANQVDRVLSDYSSSIHGSSHSNNSCQKKGALLLCVVGKQSTFLVCKS